MDRAAADAVRDFCEENSITGIRINQDSKRWYPQGAFLASVLGFTNVDNAGVAGLELKYDDLLTGENGVVLTAVNAWGYTLEQSYETERLDVYKRQSSTSSAGTTANPSTTSVIGPRTAPAWARAFP